MKLTLPHISGEFRLVAEPQLKFLPSGKAALRLRLLGVSRKKDEDGNWADDKKAWITAVGYGDMAENIAESLDKGDLVQIEGRLVTEEYTNREGEHKSDTRILIDGAGAGLRFRTMKHSKYAAEQEASAAFSAGQNQQGAAQSQDEAPSQPASEEGGEEAPPPF